ncbi:L10-interacting MYB domain-containing protein-like [Prosopis cineraria]|uniref:L10-interacting MYB domain-containing protein-like n=1 Tax=Prosopis cineraria TaxID=364024 RepID=UPI00240ED7D9|nr:L10-interacting MYB domain-containing protein-like [Prosopis cineraria]
MPNGVFHSRTWTSMTARLNSITNHSFNVKQLKQKVNQLQSMHREFTLLLKLTGFRWSAETNTVTASEEVWQNYLQAHKKAAQFRKKGCDHYKLLGIIFNRSTATGVLHHSFTQDPPNSDEENELKNQYLNSGVHRDDKDSSNDDIQEVEHITQSGKCIIRTKEHKSKKESRKYQMTEALAAWAEASKVRAEKYKGGKSVEANSEYTVAKCVIALEEIEGIRADIFVKALEKFRKYDWREMFLTMSVDGKRKWLDML